MRRPFATRCTPPSSACCRPRHDWLEGQTMSNAESEFSKLRLEMLCDGVFAIAMTLLALELKVPDLPRQAGSAEIWHALREHGLPFFGFVLTFALAGSFWIAHHMLFQYLRGVNRHLAYLTIPFLMFVSLLPFTTSMLTSFTLRQPVGLLFYLGDQLMLAVLLAAHWLVATRSGLLAPDGDDAKRREFGRMVYLQPIAFLVSLAFIYISPRNALGAFAITLFLLIAVVKRMESRASGLRT